MTVIKLGKDDYPLKRNIIKSNLVITAHVAVISMVILSLIIGVA